MGHKKVCLDCKLALNRGFDSSSEFVYCCPNCGKPMTLYPHRFRPPKKTDERKWATVKYLFDHGFNYQHIYEINEPEIIKKHATYPDNLREAKEFVEKYKGQAVTFIVPQTSTH